jgi:predicted nuclease with TOPRIM domain
MEKYPNIMKFVDKELAEQENLIDYYRNKQTEWEEEKFELTQHIAQLESENKSLIEELKRLDQKLIDYETPKKVANV